MRAPPCRSFDIGASSGALVSITTPATSGTLWHGMSTLRSGMVVSSSLLGALLGSLAALLWGQALGRRKELLMAAWFYGEHPTSGRTRVEPIARMRPRCVCAALLATRCPFLAGGGSVLVGIAPAYSLMLAGRVLYGIGIGLAMHAAPAYIAGATRGVEGAERRRRRGRFSSKRSAPLRDGLQRPVPRTSAG